MIFNSIEFLIFLPVTFILYWFVFNRSLKIQNFLLLISSYVFYGWWDWRFLSLVIISTFVDYLAGIKINASEKKSIRKTWLWVSIIFNLGMLGFFKYFNFFIDSMVSSLGSLGFDAQSTWTLNIILPVGISFYTFQTMSYTIDVYRKQLEPTKDFFSFATYVAFFPQLVAGPIERASNLLPQILKPRTFKDSQGIDGIKLIIWGMFKKVVIADSLAPMVDAIFSTHTEQTGGTLVLGAILFAFQIYGDFSGYSDIAIGTAKLFGIELMSNFKFPYFSRDIAEFWRRWHISLSTWFRDYLYIPLGGSKGGKWASLRNIFVIFIVSGFWHGANLTFLVWGGIHSLMYVPIFLLGTNRKYLREIAGQHKWFPKPMELGAILLTFGLVTLSWIFFRAESLSHSFSYLNGIFTNFSMVIGYKRGIIYCAVLIFMEWLLKEDERLRQSWLNSWLGRIFFGILIIMIIDKFSGYSQFIYFQF
jgi:alginate O-acetyltransferase complex protein AlgI